MWGYIGNFQDAEELTQDTFVRAYQKLSTLKDRSKFVRWLYIIAKRHCLNWQRKQNSMRQIQSLEDTPMEEVANADYARYLSDVRETAATEQRLEIVEKLLAKLPESERVVMALYYLGELTTKEIGEFLGISVETIRTRLHRARKRLREEEELLIQEVLGGFQMPSTIKQNIMRRVVDMTPSPTWTMDRLLPWIGIVIALVLTILLVFNIIPRYTDNLQKQDSFNIVNVSDQSKDEVSFEPDFTLTVGTHKSGRDLLNALIEKNCRVSFWSIQALEHPDFPVSSDRMTVEIVVVSMLDLGFVDGEFATLDVIYQRAKQMGLEVCPVEAAVHIRHQFLNQPDYSTGDRLGEFFVASEPFFLTREGLPKIFSVVRDDSHPHPDTGIGLWLIANGTVNIADDENPHRLFNASSTEDFDYGGRFAFVIPK